MDIGQIALMTRIRPQSEVFDYFVLSLRMHADDSVLYRKE